MAKRCLIVTYYFPPLGGGGVQRMAKLCKYLARAGWQVTVITADEPSTHIEKDDSLLKEVPPSVQIIRITAKLPFTYRMKSEKVNDKGRISYYKRWLSAFLFVPDIRKSWIQPAKQAVLEELKKKYYDCILVSSPPYSLAILAQELTAHTAVPVILDMRDPWTINPYKIHPTFFHRLLDKRFEQQAVLSVKYGISVTKNLLSHYTKTLQNFKQENWRYIPNGYDEEDFTHIPTPYSHQPDTFNIAFSGTFYSHLNQPNDLFAALSLLNKNRYKLSKRLQFHHIGKSNINLNKLVKKWGLEMQVIQHGYLPHLRALALLDKMDVFCLILDSRNPESRYALGSKLYEYLRLRKPILALLPRDSEAAETIINAEAGVIVESSEHHKIAQILKGWIENPPNFSFKGIEQFSRENQARAFIRFFEDIARAEREVD
ncbi:MAG TPA: glycosyltransferase [Calditrichaeota bacterium]|nr:glycosyltransferase [Calditrichota bacterium]